MASSIDSEVLKGHFASAVEAIAEAWRTFLRQRPRADAPAGMGSIIGGHS